MHTNLASILRQAELISLTQESAIIELIQAKTHTVSSALLAQGIFSSDELLNHLAHIFGLEIVDVTQSDYAVVCQKLGLRELIIQYQALPIYHDNNTIRLAV